MAGHKLSKHGMGRYQYKNCQKTFSFPNSFKDHTDKSNNNKTKVFTCETCNNQFTTKRAMSIHIQSEHQGRLYKCMCVNPVGKPISIRQALHNTENHTNNRTCFVILNINLTLNDLLYLRTNLPLLPYVYNCYVFV